MGIEFGRRLPLYERGFRAVLFLMLAFGPTFYIQLGGLALLGVTFVRSVNVPKLRSVMQ